MARGSTIWIRLAQALLIGVLAFNVWKACNVPITTDEAMSYNEFASRDLQKFFGSYDANHHVLHNFLCRYTVRWFGVSEFSMRLPSLLAGAFYLLLIYRFACRLFDGWLFLVAVALLAMNPFVLDYLSLARGYSMALAFWMLALYWAWTRPGALYRIALALAFSVSSNLAFLFPALALLCVFIPVAIAEGRRPFEIVEQLLLPACVVAILILVLPLSKAQPSDFYYGSDSLCRLWGRLPIFPLEMGPCRVPAGCARAFSGVGVAAGRRCSFLSLEAAAAGVAALGLADRRHGAVRAAGTIRGAPSRGRALPVGPHGHLLRSTVDSTCARTREALARADCARVVARAGFRHSIRVALERPSVCRMGTGFALVRIATRIRSAQTSTKPVRISASHPLEQGLNFYSRKFRWRDWSEVKSLEERSPSEFRVLAPPDDALAAVNGWSVVYRDEATRILVVRE